MRTKPVGIVLLVSPTLAACLAAGVTASPATNHLPAALLGRWVTTEASDVIISEGAAQMFCPDGGWFSNNSKGTRSGKYELRDGKLCIQPHGEAEHCNRISFSRNEIELYEDGSQARVRLTPAYPSSKGDDQGASCLAVAQ